jgi:hypothetical protein
MIRVVNNVNVRFNEGYFGWIKFEITPAKIKDLEKVLKFDEEVVRFLVVSTVRENTVYTKRAPVVKAETLAENEVDIDTTSDEDVAPVVEASTVEAVK